MVIDAVAQRATVLVAVEGVVAGLDADIGDGVSRARIEDHAVVGPFDRTFDRGGGRRWHALARGGRAGTIGRGAVDERAPHEEANDDPERRQESDSGRE